MRQPECGTNTNYLVDFIQICLAPKLLNSIKIRDLYLKNARSKAQIAEQFGVAESTITRHLHANGIHGGTGKGRHTNPENYRHHTPPYGYCVKGGRLVLNKAEQRVCKLAVELAVRQKINHSEVARRLTERGFRNRAGRTKWDSKTVFNIVRRWNGKI